MFIDAKAKWQIKTGMIPEKSAKISLNFDEYVQIKYVHALALTLICLVYLYSRNVFSLIICEHGTLASGWLSRERGAPR